LQLVNEFLTEKIAQKESDIQILKNDTDRLKEECLMLKTAVKEGDKTREVLARQMTHALHEELKL
jgi:FtsZ-binding cell division protein ZapB